MTPAYLLAALLVAGVAADAFAAESQPREGRPEPASFTAAQAYQGRYDYIQYCGECHGGDLGGNFGPALAGQNSNVPWQTPKAVYAYMTQQMPVGNAGGLTPSDYLNIEAFLLQANGRRATGKALTLTAIARDTSPLDQ